MAETVENEPDHRPPCSSQRQPACPPPPQPPRPLQRGIVIQLTGTEGEWDSLDDGDLIFPLDGNEDGPPVSSLKRGPWPKERQAEVDWSLHSAPFHVPLSPSSPGSLGDLSVSAPSFLSPHSPSATAAPAPRPLASLVKSLSTEIESKEASSLKPRPLLSLVKSISTEISRSEPEVSQSKSDSRLNLHLWRQLTQPKGRNGDSRTAPPSPSSLSPSEPKGGFFKVELEDTRRKLTEAMHEPLSMFSKIMGDEGSGSPKLQRPTGSSDSPGHRGGCGGGVKVAGDLAVAEPHGRGGKRAECDCLSACATPVRRPRRGPLKPCLSAELGGRLPAPPAKLEICTYGDLIQVVEIKGQDQEQGLLGELVGGRPCPAVPGRWLYCVATLAYGYFILPLPPYASGLTLGLVCGFMLGLLAVLLLAPRHPAPRRKAPTLEHHLQLPNEEHRDPEVLKGWMNEMQAYDPETYHPSLTQSVHVTLEGSALLLEYPRSNIPRRAAFDEPPHEASFIRSRRFQLANSKVFLLPPALARKRVWNQKYPADQPIVLYLFGRTGREKEEWFQRFLSASMTKEKEIHSAGSRMDVSGLYGSSPSGWAQCNGGSSRGSTEDLPSLLRLRDLAGSMREKILLDYNTYMSRFTSSESGSPVPSPSHSAEGSPTDRRQLLCEFSGARAEPQPVWINALIGRIFWDFLREKYWADQVAHKIQKKLSKIRLPYFMNELTLTELDMGTSMPQVMSTSKPSVNNRGLWLELEVVYTGCLQMTLETKMNLCKLGKESGLEADSVPEPGSVASRPRLCVLADSDEESSSAGSSDEEELPPPSPREAWEKRAPPLVLKAMVVVAQAGRFSVEVQELSGTLAINIPPPPTDRIWYSFCVPPRLDLRVRPKLGEREVTFTHVTEWIEGKLQHEFQKVFVMPNMDDIYLPLMHAGLDNPPASQHSPVESSRQSSLDSMEKPMQENSAESE
ncbi:hypothetical protein AGOR_G00090360 [Albula goreensis]|uniref:SMP-LTD domain-containing protein n=1 Tax=Albula goreensis TaxID=1534307 RepID=A0A8T3DIU6_9TELE|nr:hypothetical protein AGOR_G00090360 [Albula goreensis]